MKNIRLWRPLRKALFKGVVQRCILVIISAFFLCMALERINIEIYSALEWSRSNSRIFSGFLFTAAPRFTEWQFISPNIYYRENFQDSTITHAFTMPPAYHELETLLSTQEGWSLGTVYTLQGNRSLTLQNNPMSFLAYPDAINDAITMPSYSERSLSDWTNQDVLPLILSDDLSQEYSIGERVDISIKSFHSINGTVYEDTALKKQLIGEIVGFRNDEAPILWPTNSTYLFMENISQHLPEDVSRSLVITNEHPLLRDVLVPITPGSFFLFPETTEGKTALLRKWENTPYSEDIGRLTPIGSLLSAGIWDDGISRNSIDVTVGVYTLILSIIISYCLGVHHSAEYMQSYYLSRRRKLLSDKWEKTWKGLSFLIPLMLSIAVCMVHYLLYTQYYGYGLSILINGSIGILVYILIYFPAFRLYHNLRIETIETYVYNT